MLTIATNTKPQRVRGVVKSLEILPCGPVSLVHTQNSKIASEKPNVIR